MVAVLRSPLLPDEISAAARTVRDSYRAAAPHKAMQRRYWAFYLALLNVGCVTGALLQDAGVVAAVSGDFWRAALSLLAVLTGFMITTLSFTGKAEAAKSLTLEQLQGFTAKSNHLLFSQLSTLCSHIAGIIVIGCIFLTQPFAPDLARVLVTIAFGLLFSSLFRSLLVPIQIIELHRFTHAALLAEKRSEAERMANDL